MKLVIEMSEADYTKVKDGRASVSMMRKLIRNGFPLPKGHGDLIDRSKLDVTPIDITDLPTDRCLLVYMAEDVDRAHALVGADKESEDKR